MFSFVLTLVVYTIVGHWIWGGGWLANPALVSRVMVYSVGGWAAFPGMILGPRLGNMIRTETEGDTGSQHVSCSYRSFLYSGSDGSALTRFHNESEPETPYTDDKHRRYRAVLTATAASWIFIGKPDLGMTINGCLAGLVAVTGGCAYISVTSSLIVGAIAGVIVVFAVILFDRAKIDDPVGATSVHLVCGVFGTLCVGLFAQEGVTGLSTVDGLFFGGGLSLLGKQLLGIIAVGAFVFVASSVIWLALKKTVGIRVSS